jgi:hypothetical protein
MNFGILLISFELYKITVKSACISNYVVIKKNPRTTR